MNPHQTYPQQCYPVYPPQFYPGYQQPHYTMPPQQPHFQTLNPLATYPMYPQQTYFPPQPTQTFYQQPIQGYYLPPTQTLPQFPVEHAITEVKTQIIEVSTPEIHNKTKKLIIRGHLLVGKVLDNKSPTTLSKLTKSVPLLGALSSLSYKFAAERFLRISLETVFIISIDVGYILIMMAYL